MGWILDCSDLSLKSSYRLRTTLLSLPVIYGGLHTQNMFSFYQFKNNKLNQIVQSGPLNLHVQFIFGQSHTEQDAPIRLCLFATQKTQFISFNVV